MAFAVDRYADRQRPDSADADSCEFAFDARAWAYAVARAVMAHDAALHVQPWWKRARLAEGKRISELLPVSQSMWSRVLNGVSKPSALLVIAAYGRFGVDPRGFLKCKSVAGVDDEDMHSVPARGGERR